MLRDCPFRHETLSEKRFEFLRELVPNLRRLAIMGNVSYPSTALEMSEIKATATALGIAATVVEIQRADDIVQAFQTLKDAVDAVFVCNDALVNANYARIN